jgi:hypothetical protein
MAGGRDDFYYHYLYDRKLSGGVCHLSISQLANNLEFDHSQLEHCGFVVFSYQAFDNCVHVD